MYPWQGAVGSTGYGPLRTRRGRRRQVCLGPVRRVRKPGGDCRGDRADEDEIEDNGENHHGLGQLSCGVDVAVADLRHGHNREIERVRPGLNAPELVLLSTIDRLQNTAANATTTITITSSVTSRPTGSS